MPQPTLFEATFSAPRTFSQEWSAWDARHRRVRAGLALATRAGAGEPGFNLSLQELRNAERLTPNTERRTVCIRRWMLDVDRQSGPPMDGLVLWRARIVRSFLPIEREGWLSPV